MKRFTSALLEKIAPKQTKGNESLTVTQRTLHNPAYTISLFKTVHERLLDVNHWQRYAGKATAHFQLLDASGNEVQRHAREGDFFQIDIPGPGTKSGKGNDWVQVKTMGQELEHDEEIIFMTVNTAANPLALNTDTAHFFNRDATSTFFVHKRGMQLTAGVLGRNEKPNTGASTFFDRIRNLLVAMGAISGLSKIQWKALTKGLLHYQVDDH